MGCQKSTHTLHKPDYLCMAEMQKKIEEGAGLGFGSTSRGARLLALLAEGPGQPLLSPPAHSASISHGI